MAHCQHICNGLSRSQWHTVNIYVTVDPGANALMYIICICIWSEPSVRRISTSVSIVCTVVAEQTDPRCTLSSTDMTHKGDSV